jgi:DNA-directed RNA polymerase subunit F
VSEVLCHSLEVFQSTIEVMLVDGVLTREEKRLVIKLASSLNLEEDQPSKIYEAVRTGKTLTGGLPITLPDAKNIYTKVFEIAIVNASLSRDEFRVLAHLRDVFKIDDKEHEKIEAELREIVKQKFEDPNVIDKMLGTLRDSVSLVGDLFDVVRKKTADGAKK